MRNTKVLFVGILMLLAISCSQEKRVERAAAPAQSPPVATRPAQPQAPAEQPPAQPDPAAQVATTPATVQQAPAVSSKPRPAPKKTAAPARSASVRPASSVPADAAPNAPTATREASEVTPPVPVQATVPQAPAAPAPPPAPPAPVYVTLPAGTPLPVRFTKSLTTAENLTGDRFEAVIDSDVSAGGHAVFPKGTLVYGRLIQVERSGRVEGRASMSLTLTEIRPERQSYAVKTETLNFEAESTAKKDAVKVGAGAAIGSVIGAIAGGGKGAAIGAAIGGGAGAGTVLATRGKDVQFSPEDRLSFRLDEDLQIRIR